MRDTLLKLTVGLTLVAGLGMWLWPQDEPAPPPAEPPSAEPPPPAATSLALSKRESPATESPVTPAPLTAAQLTEHAKQQLALDPETALADIARADQLAGPAPDAQNET
ncbi:MAG TPA: hypothetical protein VFN67_06345, partial [Polyangiales bacterium]|nr:hypothetical protein [Polyangiales bacterium]